MAEHAAGDGAPQDGQETGQGGLGWPGAPAPGGGGLGWPADDTAVTDDTAQADWPRPGTPARAVARGRRRALRARAA